MLVLARLRDESIMIGDDIEVTVVDIRGDKVRLGINAPRWVAVHRKEVYDAIRRENLSAAGMTPHDLPPAGRPRHAMPNPTPGPADPFLLAALDEARQGLKEGGLPAGAVLVRDGKIISTGRNRRIQDGNPLGHAEIDCLIRAGRQTTYRDTVLYSTLMPCFMCAGAVVQFGIPKVVAGDAVNFRGSPELMRTHGTEVVDLNNAECIELAGEYIRRHPDVWHEDIGR